MPTSGKFSVYRYATLWLRVGDMGGQRLFADKFDRRRRLLCRVTETGPLLKGSFTEIFK